MTEQSNGSTRRFEIRPGTPVLAGDKNVGRVSRVVVSPGTGEITGVVVRKGLILHRDVVIPIDAVVDANEEYVQLSLSPEDLNRLPQFREEDYTAAPTDWPSANGSGHDGTLFSLRSRLHPRGMRAGRSGQAEARFGGKPIRSGQKVLCRDGEVGSLDLVLVDPETRRATYFVVRRGGLLGRDTIVPVDWVRDVERDRIYLDVSCQQLDELPEYRSDDEITADVLDALWYTSDLLPADLQFVEVITRDGIVELRGHTLTEETKRKIENVVWQVSGVLGVHNHLQSFEELTAAIHRAQHAADWRPAAGNRAD